MALVTSRTGLSQGAETTETVAWTSSSVRATTLTGTGLPVVAEDDFFEIRLSPIAGNNGLYQASGTPSTSSITCNKVDGADPTDDAAESVTWLGDTSTYKSVYFGVSGKQCAILEQGNVDVAGVTGQAIYSFAMQEWKDDSFLIANAPFPFNCIDSDAGKYIIGQDPNGNNNGWTFLDSTTYSIQTRKLLRNMGCNEIDADGNVVLRSVGIVTLGAFEDETAVTGDNAYYRFGTDTTTDTTVDFTFTGPVNEMVTFFEEFGNPATCEFASSTTITRASGSFIDDGYVVGGQVTIRNATTGANNGTETVTAVVALTLTCGGASWTPEVDTAAILAVNNANAITLGLRVRDADTYGKTFGQANLASAGKTVLGNFVYAFPLANATDLKVEATDIQIDANSDGAADVSPYDGMSINYYATPQAQTGLVGGSKDFGIIIVANNGTAQQVYEFVQWSLRSTGGNGTGDIDAEGGDVAIGRTMSGLMRFVGENLEVGSTDGGLTFPYNPEGGGTGVFVTGLNATSANSVSFWDNTQPSTPLAFPETIAVTLDFNATLVADSAAEYDLFYDRTKRTAVSDFVLTETTDLMTSALGLLPDATVGDYVRVAGTNLDALDMDGIYQIVTINTANEDWEVARYDNVTIVTVAEGSANVDDNCIDTPDAIIVHTNVRVAEVGASPAGTAALAFVSPDQVTDSDNGLAVFTVGMKVQIEGTTANDGIYEVATSVAGQLDFVEQTIVEEAVGVDTTGVITQVVSGLTSDDDFTFSYDFDGNVQGGRTVSTSTYVKAKAIGASTAQYTESTVQTIATGTPLTIPLVSQTERNYA